jgi:hypothetical protein
MISDPLFQMFILTKKQLKMQFVTPHTLKAEHEELYKMLKQVTRLPGKTGHAAKKLAQLLHPHFVEEENYALPPLGILPVLVSGNVFPQMKEVIRMTDQLKENFSKMLDEHRAIVEVLEELKKSAVEEKQPQVVAFAESLMRHAQTEEEIFYPAAILVGEYLKLRIHADEDKPVLYE